LSKGGGKFPLWKRGIEGDLGFDYKVIEHDFLTSLTCFLFLSFFC
jgi:hypothetical protein